MQRTLLLTLVAISLGIAGCGTKGFKPVKDEMANWRLKKEFNTFDLSTNEGFLQRIQKQLDDFRECGIDPMFGLAEPGHDAAEGYICIESKGWYNAAGPTCTRWLLFDKPACVEWRKERGLEHMPKPERK